MRQGPTTCQMLCLTLWGRTPNPPGPPRTLPAEGTHGDPDATFRPPSLPCSRPRLGLEPPFSKQPPALSAFGLCSGFTDEASSGGACHGGVRNCPIVWKLIWAQAPSVEPGPGLGAAEARGPLTRSTPGPRGKRPPSSLRHERLAPEPVQRLCGYLVFCLHPRSPRTMTLYTNEVHV